MVSTFIGKGGTCKQNGVEDDRQMLSVITMAARTPAKQKGEEGNQNNIGAYNKTSLAITSKI